MALPVYLVMSEGPLLDRCRTEFPDAEWIAPPPDTSALLRRGPGLVLLDASAAVSAALVRLGSALTDPGWTLAALDPEDPVWARTLSVGKPEPLEAARAFADDPAANRGTLLDLARTLREISTARHDINNPLTAALAEVQLLLMDEPEGALRESLDQLQAQLRRIRDLVAGTHHLRTPRSP